MVGLLKSTGQVPKPQNSGLYLGHFDNQGWESSGWESLEAFLQSCACAQVVDHPYGDRDPLEL